MTQPRRLFLASGTVVASDKADRRARDRERPKDALSAPAQRPSAAPRLAAPAPPQVRSGDQRTAGETQARSRPGPARPGDLPQAPARPARSLPRRGTTRSSIGTTVCRRPGVGHGSSAQRSTTAATPSCFSPPGVGSRPSRIPWCHGIGGGEPAGPPAGVQPWQQGDRVQTGSARQMASSRRHASRRRSPSKREINDGNQCQRARRPEQPQPGTARVGRQPANGQGGACVGLMPVAAVLPRGADGHGAAAMGRRSGRARPRNSPARGRSGYRRSGAARWSAPRPRSTGQRPWTTPCQARGTARR
jgi:hypothetical protein